MWRGCSSPAPNCQAPLRRGSWLHAALGRYGSLPSPPPAAPSMPAVVPGHDGCVRGSSLLCAPPAPGDVPRHCVPGGLLRGCLYGSILEGPGRRLTDYGRMVSWSGCSCRAAVRRRSCCSSVLQGGVLHVWVVCRHIITYYRLVCRRITYNKRPLRGETRVHVLTGQRQDRAACMSKRNTPGRLLHYRHAAHAGRSQVARPAQLLLAWEPAVGRLAGSV